MNCKLECKLLLSKLSPRWAVTVSYFAKINIYFLVEIKLPVLHKLEVTRNFY